MKYNFKYIKAFCVFCLVWSTLVFTPFNNTFASSELTEIKKILKDSIETRLDELNKVVETVSSSSLSQTRKDRVLAPVTNAVNKLNELNQLDYNNIDDIEKITKDLRIVYDQKIYKIILPRSYQIIYGDRLYTLAVRLEEYESQVRNWMRQNNRNDLLGDLNEFRRILFDGKNKIRQVITNAESVMITSGDTGTAQLQKDYEILVSGYAGLREASDLALKLNSKLITIN